MSAVNRLCMGVTKWDDAWHCDRHAVCGCH